VEYPAAVQRHFAQPRNVGPLDAGALPLHRGEAGSAAAGAWVVFEAEIGGQSLRRLGFQAFGCPYLIAACSRATELLTGAPATALDHLDLVALGTELKLPAEKLGSLLILQDALRNCFRDWDTTQPAGAR
jgi:NifU-like protein involved in Fe-S cluster formation